MILTKVQAEIQSQAIEFLSCHYQSMLMGEMSADISEKSVREEYDQWMKFRKDAIDRIKKEKNSPIHLLFSPMVIQMAEDEERNAEVKRHVLNIFKALRGE